MLPPPSGDIPEYSPSQNCFGARDKFGGVIATVEAIAWWKEQKVPVWGVIPERVGIAAGPEARLYREGLNEYGTVLQRALRRR